MHQKLERNREHQEYHFYNRVRRSSVSSQTEMFIYVCVYIYIYLRRVTYVMLYFKSAWL